MRTVRHQRRMWNEWLGIQATSMLHLNQQFIVYDKNITYAITPIDRLDLRKLAQHTTFFLFTDLFNKSYKVKITMQVIYEKKHEFYFIHSFYFFTSSLQNISCVGEVVLFSLRIQITASCKLQILTAFLEKVNHVEKDYKENRIDLGPVSKLLIKLLLMDILYEKYIRLSVSLKRNLTRNCETRCCFLIYVIFLTSMTFC